MIEIIEGREGFVRARLFAACVPCGGDLIMTFARGKGARRAVVMVTVTCLDLGHPDCPDGEQVIGPAQEMIEMIRERARQARLQE